MLFAHRGALDLRKISELASGSMRHVYRIFFSESVAVVFAISSTKQQHKMRIGKIFPLVLVFGL